MKQIAIIFFIYSLPIFAQAPNNNWIKVVELNDQYIFVDTTNIKQIEKQISAVGLTVYKEKQFVESIKKEAYSVKTQFIFDTENNKYTVIGTLYYDNLWRILGESSVPGASITNPLFAIAIDTSSTVGKIYKNCTEFLERKNFAAKQKELSKSTDSGRLAKKEKPIQTEIKKDTSAQAKANREALTEKFIDKKINEDSKQVFIDKPKRSEQKIIPQEKTQSDADYNLTAEKNIQKTIFTDGSKYCFQVSSWPNKAKAEQEVNKLKAKGHNAFITEAYLPNKGGTWYRVRIGYFNSLQETDNYMKNFR